MWFFLCNQQHKGRQEGNDGCAAKVCTAMLLPACSARRGRLAFWAGNEPDSWLLQQVFRRFDQGNGLDIRCPALPCHEMDDNDITG